MKKIFLKFRKLHYLFHMKVDFTQHLFRCVWSLRIEGKYRADHFSFHLESSTRLSLVSTICTEAVAQRCFVNILRNFSKFTGKHLCQGLFLNKLQALVFFNKVACLRPATLFKKRLWRRCFPMNFAQFLRTSFRKKHHGWLLLTLGVT